MLTVLHPVTRLIGRYVVLSAANCCLESIALLMVVSVQQAYSPRKDRMKEQLSSNTDPEMQEVQNLPFESATLKAEHYHWSEKCSNGIQQMLATRQQRHDASLQAYLTIRCAANGLNAEVIRIFGTDGTAALRTSTAFHSKRRMLSSCSSFLLLQ